MSKHTLLLGGVIAVVAATAAVAPAARADLRIEERATSLDSTATRWTFVKGDRRSVVTRQEVNGVLYNAGAKYGARVEIARPDRELIWELDPQERSYREVRLAQFSKLLQKGIQAPRDPNDQPLRTLYKSETTAIEVVPTGKTKRIAGLQAEEVVARVVVGATNLQSGNKFAYTFDQTIWITKDERVVKESRGFEEAYAEVFGSPLTLAQAELLSGTWNDAFVTHIRAMSDRIRALGGFPLSVSTTVTEEALAQGKGEKSNSRQLTVGSMEVRSISFDSIDDNEFELPVGYINQDTKVAVAPREGMPAAPTTIAKNDVAPVTPPAEGMPKVAEQPKSVPVKVASKNDAAPGTAAANTSAAAAGTGTPSATPRPNPGPVVALKPNPPVGNGVPVVTGVPTNVVSANDPKTPKGGPRDTAFKPKTTPVLVTAYKTQPIQDNIPVLSASGTTRVSVDTPVTVDEPDFGLKPKKKRR